MKRGLTGADQIAIDRHLQDMNREREKPPSEAPLPPLKEAYAEMLVAFKKLALLDEERARRYMLETAGGVRALIQHLGRRND